MSKLSKIGLTQNEIDKLSSNHRHLVCAYLAGESYRDLSFNFGIPIGTVKSRLSRATAKLLENRKNAECISQ